MSCACQIVLTQLFGLRKNIRIHRFIRLLRLGSSSFQSFFDQERHGSLPSEIDKAIAPWLLQVRALVFILYASMGTEQLIVSACPPSGIIQHYVCHDDCSC